MTDSERLAALERDGVRIVRVTYPDLHGTLRGKDVPIGVFASTVAEHGLNFCKAISTVDLRHNVVSGFEHWPPTMTSYAYGDPVGGYNAAAALMLGLCARQRGGRGRFINMSQVTCVSTSTTT